MGTPSNCPCDAVKGLKEMVLQHDAELKKGAVNFALIKQDLEYIKGSLDSAKKNKLSIENGVIIAVLSALLSFLASVLLAKFGII